MERSSENQTVKEWRKVPPQIIDRSSVIGHHSSSLDSFPQTQLFSSSRLFSPSLCFCLSFLKFSSFLPKTTCERKSSVITELPDLLSPFTRHIFDLKRNRENEPGFGSQTWTRSERIKRWKKWPQLMTLIRSFSFY